MSRLIGRALALLIVLGGGSTVLAHGEETLELGLDRIQPGGSLEVRGDLGVGDRFDVTLVSDADGTRRTVATIAASEEGHFDSYVTVPVDLADGQYLVEVSALDVADPATARAEISVAGSPIGQDGERPDQAEGLPGATTPGPSAGGDAPGAGTPAASASIPRSAGSGVGPLDSGESILLAGAVLLLVVAGVGIGIILRARRPGRDRA